MITQMQKSGSGLGLTITKHLIAFTWWRNLRRK